jgi:hypothetical protein
MKKGEIEEIKFRYVCDKYPPNRYTIFAYKWFNVNTFRKPYPVGTWLAILAFFVGTTGMIIYDRRGEKKKATKFAYVLMGFFVLVLTLPAYLMNQARIKTICEELEIDVEEYNRLVLVYYPENK